MQRQVRHTLHIETPAPARYRQILVVEQAGHFEVLILEDAFLPSNKLIGVGHDRKSARGLHPTQDVANAAADEEMRKSVAAGWILYSR